MPNGEQERDLEKVPEAGYNSGRFLAMVRNPQFFRQQLPRVVREVVVSQPLQLEDGQAALAQQQMYDTTYRLWNEGSQQLLMWVYGEYARGKGLEGEKDTEMLGRIKTVKGLEELSPEEVGDWQTYLDTTDLPRQVALDAVRMNIHFDLPSVRYIYDPSVRFLHSRLKTVPYQLALTILPDIKDEEAKRLFGQLSSAEEVKKIAFDPAEAL